MANIITSGGGASPSGPGLSFWLGSKVLNQPLAMLEDSATQLAGALRSGVFDGRQAIPLAGAGMSKFTGSPVRNAGYRVTDDGIAIVSVAGVLLDRGNWLGDLGGWATSYEGLAEQCDKLVKDSSIWAVAFDIDSGGGVAAGLFDFIAKINVLKKKKRVFAVAANTAASAAYAIGCAAHEFHVSRGGIAGSIGVINVHMSYQQMLENSGIEPTIIHAGEHKADANHYQALSHGARSEMARGIDDIYDAFVSHVAKARDMDEEAVRATEARVYAGKRAVSAGLADSVKSFDELLTHIRKSKSGNRKKISKKGERIMSKKPAVTLEVGQNEQNEQTPVAPTASVPSVPDAQVEATAATAAPAPAGPKAEAGDERGRIKAILTSAEAQGCKDQAEYIAFDTDMSVEAALAMMAKAPQGGDEEAAEPAMQAANENSNGLNNALANEMAKPGNSAGVKPDSGQASRPSLADKMKSRAKDMKSRRLH